MARARKEWRLRRSPRVLWSKNLSLGIFCLTGLYVQVCVDGDFFLLTFFSWLEIEGPPICYLLILSLLLSLLRTCVA